MDSSGTTRYVYDGSTIIADTNSSGTIQNYYLPGVGFTTAAGVQRYYRENALGSNLATTNSAGTVDSRTEYDGYGVEYNVLAGTKSPFKFAGKHGYVTDDQSGLDMLGVRYYAPTLGRFLTQDPTGHDAGPNLYQYADQNPARVIDPSGKIGISGLIQAINWFFYPHGHGWKTEEGAAIAATFYYSAQTAKTNTEYGGYMFIGSDGLYYTPIRFTWQGNIHSVPQMGEMVEGAIAEWHTHPREDLRYYNEKSREFTITGYPYMFSNEDRARVDLGTYTATSYLGSPCGLHRYTKDGGAVDLMKWNPRFPNFPGEKGRIKQ